MSELPGTSQAPYFLYAQGATLGDRLRGWGGRLMLVFLTASAMALTTGPVLLRSQRLLQWVEARGGAGSEVAGYPWELAFYFLLVSVMVVLVPAAVTRWFYRQDRRRQGLVHWRQYRGARLVLDRAQSALVARLGRGEQIRNAWVSGGPSSGPILKTQQFLMGLFLALQGIGYSLALTETIGNPGIWIGGILLLGPGFLLLLSPGYRFWTDVAMLVTSPICYCLVVAAMPMRDVGLSGLLLGAITVVVFLAGLRSLRRNFSQEGIPRILLETTRGWFLATLDLRFQEVVDYQLVNHTSPLLLAFDESGFHFALPVAHGEKVPFTLEHWSELEVLIQRAPPDWEEGLIACAPLDTPLMPLPLLGLYGACSLVSALVLAMVLELGYTVLPQVEICLRGDPAPLREAASRLRRVHPWAGVGSALEGFAAIQQGQLDVGVPALRRARRLSGSSCRVGRLAGSFLEDANFLAFSEATLALPAQVASLPVPPGRDQRAFRLYRLALDYESLLLQHQPVQVVPPCRPLRLVQLLEDSLQASPQPMPRARRLLVEILGRVRWPVAWSHERAVPRGLAESWTRRALDLLGQGVGLTPEETRHLEGRIRFRSGEYAGARKLLATSPQPMDQLRMASCLRFLPGRLGEAFPAVRQVRFREGDLSLDGDLLTVLLLAQRGQLGRARKILEARRVAGRASSEEKGTVLSLLVDSLEHGPSPAPPGSGTGASPKGRGLALLDPLEELVLSRPAPLSEAPPTLEATSWASWMTQEDLVLLARLLPRGPHAQEPAEWADLPGPRSPQAPFRGFLETLPTRD